MTYETERVTIVTAFKTAWEAGSNLPVQWENQAFDPPTDGGIFVSLSILRGQSAHAGMVGAGVAMYRHPGTVQVDVSIAQGKGTRVGLELVDEISLIFRGKIISGIIFRAPDIRRMLEPETSRIRFIISFPFHRDANL